MSVVNLSVESEGVAECLAALKSIPGAYKRVMPRVIRRVLEGMRTEAVLQTKQKYYLSSGDIRKTITLKNGVFRSRGFHRSLREYKVAPSRPSRRGRGLTGAVKRDGGLKSLGKAFLVNRRGFYEPFIRVGKKRWDIKPLLSPAVPQAIGNEETVRAMYKKADEVFLKRIRYEMMREIGAIR